MNSGWDRVDEALRGAIQENVQIIQETLGSSLVSVILYGEAVTGGFDRRRHAVRSVAVVQKVELPMLRRLAEQGLRLGRGHMCAPLVVTLPYVQESLDTFPLEWLEIQQQGVAVVGTDLFAGLVLEPGDVRLQCEREVKQIFMGLRQALLAVTGKERAVAHIESVASDNLMRVLRGVLWLRGRREHLAAGAVLQEIEKLLGVKFEGIRAAMDHSARHDWKEFDQLYADVEILMGKANAM